MHRLYLILALLFFSTISFAQKLLSPEEFLGYKLGEKFTYHYRMVEYFKHVDAAMPNIQVSSYGQTYEGRELIYAIIVSKENFANIEQIRTDNLKRAGMLQGTASTKIPVVWLSYNVHGNESSSMEAAMWTLYELANEQNTKTKEWLKNTVVIMDPCINPDGRDRYANFYNQFGNIPGNSSGDAMEHHEPWPGGRSNHYMFDLNRDWAWATQIETQQRLKIYNQWLPHVHVDFHEQGFNNPYYFAPAAEPFHEVISPWQREFQTMIGKNNAKYFDKEGWLYFTKEVFDLFYPSYGDTYPTYSGAIGMTYEQAGSGYAGTTITTETGDQLTLLDRITHHHTTGLSTIEITSQHASRVIDEFEKYFQENNNSPTSPYKTYLIKADNNEGKINKLLRWLDLHAIQYGHTNSKTTKGFDYQTQQTSSVNVSNDDVIISIYQPKSRFITTVFEPISKIPDSLTYDITAWNLMYAYNLQAYALTEKLRVTRSYQPKEKSKATADKNAYAYIFPYKDFSDVQLLTSLLNHGIKVRAAERAFAINGKTFDPGTLIITKGNNENVKELDLLITITAKEFDKDVITTSTGFVDKGKDFGSSDLNYINPPNVAVLFGPETFSLSSGEIWHYFEQQLKYPITQIGSTYFKTTDLSPYEVLIIPEGRYTMFDEATLTRISQWVNNGGKLILVGNATGVVADKAGFNLKMFANDAQKNEAENRKKLWKDSETTVRYDETERRMVSESISGAIYKVSMDNSHPLGFGLGNNYYSLKTNELHYAMLDNGWSVGVLNGKTKPVQGFAGYKINQALNNRLIFGVENKGKGAVIYLADNPLFRVFWDSGKLLFANAVFLVNQ